MVKKLFALASVSALAGLVSAVGAAGCSETVVQQNPTDAGADTGSKKDSGPKPGNDEEPDDEVKSCVGTDAVDATKIPYNGPVNSPGACTTDELKKLTAFFKENSAGDVKISDWSAEVSAKCSACVFSEEDAATWSPILVKNDELTGVNRGGCIELLSGKASCGEAYQQVSECRLLACLPSSQGGVGTCTTQDEFTECLQDGQAIFTGPCKDAYDKMETECGDKLGTWEQACQGTSYTFEGPIKVQCITGGSGGADAGDGG